MPKSTLVSFPPVPNPKGGVARGGRNPPLAERYARRKDGLYQLELRYSDPLTGEKKKKSFYGKTQAEALKKRKAFERTLDQGISSDSPKVSEYAEFWLETYKSNLRPRTMQSYRRDVNIIISIIGQKELKAVTQSDVQSVINTRAGLSTSAIKKTSITLKALFEAARGDRYIAVSPCEKLSPPKGTKDANPHKALTPEERAFLVAGAQDHRMYIPSMLMLYAGLRRGEVISFNISRDVDFQNKTLTVREAVYFDNNTPVVGETKSDAGLRTIALLPPLDTLLLPFKDTGLVFTNASGKIASETSFKKAWDSYLYHLEVAKNGVRKRWATEDQLTAWQFVELQCHDLRHTFCTMLFDASVDVKTAQLWMGHADPMVTMRIYTHLSKQKNAASTKAAQSYFKKQSKTIKP